MAQQLDRRSPWTRAQFKTFGSWGDFSWSNAVPVAAAAFGPLLRYWFQGPREEPASQSVGEPGWTIRLDVVDIPYALGAIVLAYALVYLVRAVLELRASRREALQALTPPPGVQSMIRQLSAEKTKFYVAGDLDALWLLSIAVDEAPHAISDIHANAVMMSIVAKRREAAAALEVTHYKWEPGMPERFHFMFDLLERLGLMETDSFWLQRAGTGQPAAQRYMGVTATGIEVWRWSLVWGSRTRETVRDVSPSDKRRLYPAMAFIGPANAKLTGASQISEHREGS